MKKPLILLFLMISASILFDSVACAITFEDALKAQLIRDKQAAMHDFLLFLSYISFMLSFVVFSHLVITGISFVESEKQFSFRESLSAIKYHAVRCIFAAAIGFMLFATARLTKRLDK